MFLLRIEKLIKKNDFSNLNKKCFWVYFFNFENKNWEQNTPGESLRKEFNPNQSVICFEPFNIIPNRFKLNFVIRSRKDSDWTNPSLDWAAFVFDRFSSNEI